MGWISYYPTKFDRRGNIDRLAECRKEFSNYPHWGTILKDRMVGTTYYAAIKKAQTQEVYAIIVLTSVQNGEFCYKDMSEFEQPFYYDCPMSILKLLTPTTDKRALEWRKKCQEHNRIEKVFKTAEVIEMTIKNSFWLTYKPGQSCLLKAYKRNTKGEITRWIDSYTGYGWRLKEIVNEDYKILEVTQK